MQVAENFVLDKRRRERMNGGRQWMNRKNEDGDVLRDKLFSYVEVKRGRERGREGVSDKRKERKKGPSTLCHSFLHAC